MEEKIFFHIEDVDFELEAQDRKRKWIEEIIQSNNCQVGELNYIFCSDEYLLKVNQDYLNHDYYTDIITFDYTEMNFVSGDLFISIDRVKDNAEMHDSDFNNEVLRVMAHGVLHLLGFKDKTDSDQKEMRKQEDLWIREYKRD